MVESIVITLREGVEAALVVGIILAYLTKAGRNELGRWVYWGLASAVVASLSLALVFRLVGFDPENEYLEGIMLGLAGLFVASMVLWMWKTSRNLRRGMERRLETITAKDSSVVAGASLFAFTFLMVLREGVETVLFLQASAAGSEAGVMSLLGGLVGLSLATFFGVLLVKGSVRINLSRFFAITGIALLVLALKFLAGSAHEFGEVGLLPLNKEAMAIIGYFVRGRSSDLIMAAIIATPLLLLFWEARVGSRKTRGAAEESGPEARKRRAAARLQRTWQAGLAAVAGVVLITMASTAVAGPSLIDPAPEPVSAMEGQIRVPLTGFDEGVLRKFTYRAANGVEVRFLAARLPDGSFATGLDACEICGTKGYAQEDDVAVCKNCGAPIALDSFAFGGGCNPRVIQAQVDADALVLDEASLQAAAEYFVE